MKAIIRTNPKHAGYEMEIPVLFVSSLEAPFTAQENPHIFQSEEEAKVFLSEMCSYDGQPTKDVEMWDVVEATEDNMAYQTLSEAYPNE